MKQKQNPAVRLPQKLVDRIDEALETGLFNSKADFVRSAVRDKLAKLETTTHAQGRQH